MTNSHLTSSALAQPPMATSKERFLNRAQHLFARTHAQRHLASCRYHLPEELGSVNARSAERALMRHLWRQEFEPALDAAERLGLASEPSPHFWRELKLAAQHLQNNAHVRRHAERELHQQLRGLFR